mmetsp:Transcript_82242/g.232850  ORF Transcript_82242/g.232850 Transcript_82242/m.232850 type:complete len:247 (-) Transcript_82242:877-1617(-)
MVTVCRSKGGLKTLSAASAPAAAFASVEDLGTDESDDCERGGEIDCGRGGLFGLAGLRSAVSGVERPSPPSSAPCTPIRSNEDVERLRGGRAIERRALPGEDGLANPRGDGGDGSASDACVSGSLGAAGTRVSGDIGEVGVLGEGAEGGTKSPPMPNNDRQPSLLSFSAFGDESVEASAPLGSDDGVRTSVSPSVAVGVWPSAVRLCVESCTRPPPSSASSSLLSSVADEASSSVNASVDTSLRRW